MLISTDFLLNDVILSSDIEVRDNLTVNRNMFYHCLLRYIVYSILFRHFSYSIVNVYARNQRPVSYMHSSRLYEHFLMQKLEQELLTIAPMNSSAIKSELYSLGYSSKGYFERKDLELRLAEVRVAVHMNLVNRQSKEDAEKENLALQIYKELDAIKKMSYSEIQRELRTYNVPAMSLSLSEASRFLALSRVGVLAAQFDDESVSDCVEDIYSGDKVEEVVNALKNVAGDTAKEVSASIRQGKTEISNLGSVLSESIQDSSDSVVESLKVTLRETATKISQVNLVPDKLLFTHAERVALGSLEALQDSDEFNYERERVNELDSQPKSGNTDSTARSSEQSSSTQFFSMHRQPDLENEKTSDVNDILDKDLAKVLVD